MSFRQREIGWFFIDLLAVECYFCLTEWVIMINSHTEGTRSVTSSRRYFITPNSHKYSHVDL